MIFLAGMPRCNAASSSGREDVVSYQPKANQPKWRKKLQRACSTEISAHEPSYESAKERLRGLRAELEQINRRAARSLVEGLEGPWRSTGWAFLRSWAGA